MLFDRHYERSARYDGDEAPKKAAAHAKRVASSLRNALTEFGALLEDKDVGALQAAASVMAGLGSDLDTVSKLARDHKVAHEKLRHEERTGHADRVADAAWGADEARMLADAKELAAFVDQTHVLEVETWGLARPKCQGFRYFHMPDTPPGRRLLDMLQGQPQSDIFAIRRRAAEYLHALKAQGTGSMRRHFQELWYVGLDDFEEWRAWRRELAAAISGART